MGRLQTESDEALQSVQTHEPQVRRARRRLSWRGELILATLPTLVVLGVLLLVEIFSNQRLLFASLAASAFLIYLDPSHGTNRVRTLVLAQILAALIGFLCNELFPSVYPSAGVAMVATIVCMVLLDAVHPPAVSTSLAFAFRTTDASNLTVFALAVAMTASLVLLQRSAVWLLVRLFRREQEQARRRERTSPAGG